MKKISDIIIERLAYLIIALSVIAFAVLSVTAVNEEELSFFIIGLSELIGSFIIAVFMLGFSMLIENSNDIAENSFENLDYQRKIYEYLTSNNDSRNGKIEVKAKKKVKESSEEKERNIKYNSDDFTLEYEHEIVDEAGVIAAVTEHDIQILDDGTDNICVKIYLNFEIIGNVNNGLGLFAPVLSCFDKDDNLICNTKLILDIISGTATVNTKMTIEDKNKTDNDLKFRFVISGQ